MSEEARAAAYRLQYDRRKAKQAALDTALAGDTAARESLDTKWQPITEFIQEGPDVGEADEPTSEGSQRIN